MAADSESKANTTFCFKKKDFCFFFGGGGGGAAFHDNSVKQIQNINLQFGPLTNILAARRKTVKRNVVKWNVK